MEGKIYAQIAKIMAEVPAIGKNKNNAQQGFKFRGIDDVYNHVQPIFAKHGVFPAVQQRELMNRIEGATRSGGVMHRMSALYDVRFYADDGSFVTVTLEAEGMDSADKGTNKCHSVAHKYALLTLLMIPTEDMAEPDAHTPEPASFKKPAPAPAPAPAPVEPAPASLPAELLKQIEASGYALYGKEWTQKSAELCRAISKRRTDFTAELTAAEAEKLLAGINKKMEDEGLALFNAKPQEDLF